MSDEKIVTATGYFDGSKTKSNFDIELCFKFPEAEIGNAMEFVMGIGGQLKLIAKVKDKKLKLGTFNLYNFSVDKDANSKVRFKSNIDMCDVNSFTELMVDDELPIELKAKIV